MTENLKIYIFRHGESEYNRDNKFTGLKDVKLTPHGIQQAKLIADKLKDKVFQVAYRTRLIRSKETLNEVLRYHKNITVIEDDRIIERSYGDLEGVTHQSFIEKHGKEQFDIIHRSYDVSAPGGESIKMVEERVLDFIKDLLHKMKREKISVAISAHGNSMRPFRRYFEGFSIEKMMKIENPYDDYFEYSVPIE
ncbi:MAG TPA: histidine phosphatase family protein [Candidatus Deferrimicrobium sp.]|nr:histidine phosphatase family protein [Candidatus Deferrimicrobium sp.]